MRHSSFAIAVLAACGLLSAASAEVVDASSSRFVLKQTHQSVLSPAELWSKMVIPAKWWGDEHTFSGDAGNLTLDVTAGGLWREDWAGGSIQHGKVLSVMNGTMLRLEAPFGPIQSMGVGTALTLTISPGAEGGSVLTMDFVANGAEGAGLDALALAVDGVWQGALEMLASEHDRVLAVPVAN